MGFRLSGPPLGRPQADEILSGPTCLGSVQVPPSGLPIALMADHQTTGGYPRIAEIASADVARLAQLAPGGKVHFARCSLEMARRAAHATRAERLRIGAARHRLGVRTRNEKTIDLNCDMGESYGAWTDGRRRRSHAAHQLGEHRLRLPRRRPGDHPQDGAPRRRPRRGDRRASVAARHPGLRPPAR